MGDTVKWLAYDFQVHRMEPAWNDVPGVYIFTGIASDGKWHPYYVGKADSFKTRLVSGHEQWAPAKNQRATHVHAMVVRDETQRTKIEKELIQKLGPPLNTQHK